MKSIKNINMTVRECKGKIIVGVSKDHQLIYLADSNYPKNVTVMKNYSVEAN